jgi:hypothetical protein
MKQRNEKPIRFQENIMSKITLLLITTCLFSSCAIFKKDCCKTKQNCANSKECDLKKEGEKKPCCMGQTKKD